VAGATTAGWYTVKWTATLSDSSTLEDTFRVMAFQAPTATLSLPTPYTMVLPNATINVSALVTTAQQSEILSATWVVSMRNCTASVLAVVKSCANVTTTFVFDPLNPGTTSWSTPLVHTFSAPGTYDISVALVMISGASSQAAMVATLMWPRFREVLSLATPLQLASVNRVVAGIQFDGVSEAEETALLPWQFKFNTTLWSAAYLGECCDRTLPWLLRL
jgi:hypothetical protein